MTELQQQLPVIDRLRDRRDTLGQRMYALRTDIARTSAALRRSRVASPRESRPEDEVRAARQAIAADERRLRELAAHEAAARVTVARVEQERRHQEALRRSLEGPRAAITELRAHRAEAEQARPIDRRTIAGMEAAIAAAEARIADTERSLAASIADDAPRELDADAAREELELIAAESVRVRADLEEKERAIGTLQDATGPGAGQLADRLAELNAQYATTKAEWKSTRDRLHETIKGIYVDPHPRATVAQMPDTTPFLLLPVRIETRFVVRRAITGPVGELLVRIYPDDVAVHTHENALTDREVGAGEAYWRVIYEVEKDTDPDKATRRTQAWRTFAVLFGPSRSAWVARRTRPTNWAALATMSSADELTFPVHDMTKTSAWSRAPRTNVLPDRFVVMCYEGDEMTKEVVGEAIPDELQVGPEPLDLVAEADQADAEDSFVTDANGQVTFGGAFDWASNFDRAVEQGMGVRIPLTGNAAVQGFDRIVVLGVMASASADAGKGMLETLLANHQHSPNGLTLLAQGAATNNMEGAGSGYSVNDALAQTKEVTGIDAPLSTTPSDTDGRRLAEALGVGYETFQHVFNADNADYRQAVAMNRALYPATLGYYFDTLLPVLSDADRDRLRDFFVENVTGRGPLAPIRIGDQPYGVLLTSDFANWSDARRVERGDRFPATLLDVLEHFDEIWQGIFPKLSWAGKPGASTAETLLDVLGLQASSVTFAQRIAYDASYLMNLADFTDGDGEYGEIWGSGLRGLAINEWLRELGSNADTSMWTDWAPLLRLVYQHYTTGLDPANLIDGVPLSETAPIREYAADRNYLHWLRDASSLDALAKQNFGGAPVPTALLYLKLRHALLLQLHKTTVKFLETKGYDATVTLKARTFHNIRQSPDLSRWELMRAPVSELGISSSAGRIAVGDYVMTPGLSIDAGAYLEQMRQALDTLATMSTARLERCFVEHLDACSYRLDAWQTALFKTRLDGMRNTARPDAARRTGTYLGAYGWVENVRPSASWIAAEDVPEKLASPVGAPLREYAGNGGFIHAPSINHATAAALLRSGYMSHATPANPDVMKVNVSSERVRRALFILQGMRNGQSIEALLGYQFERGIHDRASANNAIAVLNGFIVDVRIAFPIKRVRLEGGPMGGAEETVEAYDVVNGLALVEAASPDWAAITGASPAVLTPACLAALNEERDRTADTLDAIKDILLSESAYQLVQGNFDRAGAVLGSIKDAAVPPDLDVIKTPRSSHFTFTQRVAVHVPRLDPTDPAAAAWPATMTPRALLEPGLNQWFGEVLGPPDQIVLTVFEVQEVGGVEMPVNPALLTLVDLELQPIDLVYIVGSDLATGSAGRSGASELEERVAWRYRTDRDLTEVSRIQIQFAAPKGQVGTRTVAEVMPLLHALQSVLSDSRALDARDYRTAVTTAGVSVAAPTAGFDFDDLNVRTTALLGQLGEPVTAILALPFAAIIDGGAVASLGDAFDAIRAAEKPVDVGGIPFTFSAADAMTLQQLLDRLSRFGMADAFPRARDVSGTEAKSVLVLQAMNAVAAAKARMAAATTLLADAVAKAATSTEQAVTAAIGACKAILGQSFTVLPVFAMPNEADLLQSESDAAQLLGHATGVLDMPSPVDEWIRSVAYVRPKVAAWERIRLLHETLLGTTLEMDVVQLPYRPRDSWLAVTLPDADPITGKPFDIARDTLSVVTHGEAAFTAGSLRCGVLVDSWTETIPAREQSTGISFHYNRPDSMPPQALLLAVPPVMTGEWSWDALVQVLHDTLRRAKLRAVEPALLDEITGSPEVNVLLPATISEFQQYDLNISLDLRMAMVELAPILVSYYTPPASN